MIVRDRADVLEAAIRSVREQDLPDWELVVVDDGSVDNSFETAQRAAADDTRIRVMRNARAPGIPGARNAGLESARGRYLAICDSDDLSRPHRFSIQVAALDRDPRLGGVGGGIHTFMTTPGDGLVPQWRWGVTAGRPPFPFPAAMFRAEAIRQVGGFDEDYPVAEDVKLAFDLAGAGWRLAMLEPILVDYRQSADSTFTHPYRHRLTLRAQLHGVRVLRGRMSPAGYAAIAQSGWRTTAAGYRNRFSKATAR